METNRQETNEGKHFVVEWRRVKPFEKGNKKIYIKHITPSCNRTIKKMRKSARRMGWEDSRGTEGLELEVEMHRTLWTVANTVR